jgi:hypothetical protein
MLTVAEDVVSNRWRFKKAVVFRLCSQLYISPLMNVSFFTFATCYFVNVLFGKPNANFLGLPFPAIAAL